MEEAVAFTARTRLTNLVSNGSEGLCFSIDWSSSHKLISFFLL